MDLSIWMCQVLKELRGIAGLFSCYTAIDGWSGHSWPVAERHEGAPSVSTHYEHTGIHPNGSRNPFPDVKAGTSLHGTRAAVGVQRPPTLENPCKFGRRSVEERVPKAR